MALLQKFILSGVELPETYLKISKVIYADYRTKVNGELVKRYRVEILVERHGNKDKKGVIETRMLQFDNIKEDQLSLSDFYDLIKNKFTGSQDLI